MKQDIYKTRDLAEAAALIVENQQLIEIERIGGICWFIFDSRENCQHISNKYFFGNLPVEARKYYEAMTRLKNRIFSKL